MPEDVLARMVQRAHRKAGVRTQRCRRARRVLGLPAMGGARAQCGVAGRPLRATGRRHRRRLQDDEGQALAHHLRGRPYAQGNGVAPDGCRRPTPGCRDRLRNPGAGDAHPARRRHRGRRGALDRAVGQCRRILRGDGARDGHARRLRMPCGSAVLRAHEGQGGAPRRPDPAAVLCPAARLHPRAAHLQGSRPVPGHDGDDGQRAASTPQRVAGHLRPDAARGDRRDAARALAQGREPASPGDDSAAPSGPPGRTAPARGAPEKGRLLSQSAVAVRRAHEDRGPDGGDPLPGRQRRRLHRGLRGREVAVHGMACARAHSRPARPDLRCPERPVPRGAGAARPSHEDQRGRQRPGPRNRCHAGDRVDACRRPAEADAGDLYDLLGRAANAETTGSESDAAPMEGGR